MKLCHLKKPVSILLSCALALVCVVTSAGAAFTDQNAITHKDAVTALVSLKVLDGKKDGSFDPTGLVTRAEMAKLACIAVSGANPTFDGYIKEDAISFPDVPDTHWAINFVRACASKEIITGRPDGSFDPAASVTGLEAAKMMLICVGYLPEEAGLTGEGWADATRVLALETGLLAGLEGLDLAAPLNRDNAAQMLNNTLHATLVKYDYVIIYVDGELTSRPQIHTPASTETLLTRYFDTP